MTTSQSITDHDLLTLMLDYNFLRAACMLAPNPKGFFIGTWEDYRDGVPLAGPTYLSFICDG